MYSRQAENVSQGGHARVKGPPFKQVLRGLKPIIAHDFAGKRGGGAALGNRFGDASKVEAVRRDGEQAVRSFKEVEAKQVLQACFSDISELHGKVDSLYKKAIEPDPELQTYGPAMKEKVLNLHKRYVELKDWAEKLRQSLQEIFVVADEFDEQKKRQKVLEEERMRAEEAETLIKERQREEEIRQQRLQEEEAKKQKEEEERQRYLEHARAKLLEAELRERSAAKGEGSAAAVAASSDGWVTDPILEGGEELTLEMAIELQEQSDMRRRS
ncbi:hypothetical protein GUITHDRAFT_164490, partial [Guillardia theta CCMP2712]